MTHILNPKNSQPLDKNLNLAMPTFGPTNREYYSKTYISNRVFYAEGNSNWRIRLNGATADGEKITIFSKPSLGENGGFQNKILLFTRIDDTNFRLEILEQDEMQRLIENSADWAKGGSGNGRAYGIIAE